jgi:asparagine synthase (glutamine-hydrolysing)
MCGIVGVVGKIPTEHKFDEFVGILTHRGPDDGGKYYDLKSGVALGQRRLSIIDLSVDGHQPFWSNDRRYVIVFNGEIYNYLELKEELKTRYQFKTRTDTEVLLAAYIEYGEKCLEKFNGMFAFAIWDKITGRLFCARDRLGIKPFFYFISDETFYFASEIKALLCLNSKPVVNEAVVYDYLYYGMYDHSSETFFKDLKSLSAGHCLCWQRGGVEIKKYWDLSDKNVDLSDLSLEEAKQQLGNLIADSIKLQFRSDVPVGINLSSGLDSNSLYHYALKVTGNDDINTFSMCMESEEYDECGLIESSLDAEKKKKWHSCYFNHDNLFEKAVLMNQIQDQPFGGIPTIAYNLLISLSNQSNTVVLLEGQGVDEILAGYPYYQLELEKAQGTIGTEFSQDMTRLINTKVLSQSFKKKFKDHILAFSQPFSSNLLNAQYRDICFTKLPRVLRFNDHVTMHHSRELRVPFLDHRIVEFCFFLPDKYKINNGSHKFLLRQLMKEVVPAETNVRPKKVFGAIQTEWLKIYFKEQVYNLLRSDSFRGRPYWDYKNLIEEVGLFYKGEIKNSFFIWQCLNLEMWLKNFIDSKPNVKT